MYESGEDVELEVNGVWIPAIIKVVSKHGMRARDGSYVSYTVEGNTRHPNYPRTVPYGPFSNVTSNRLRKASML